MTFDLQQLRDAVEMAKLRGWDVQAIKAMSTPDYFIDNNPRNSGYVIETPAHYLVTYPLGKNSPARGVQEVSLSQAGLERLLGLLVKESM